MIIYGYSMSSSFSFAVCVKLFVIKCWRRGECIKKCHSLNNQYNKHFLSIYYANHQGIRVNRKQGACPHGVYGLVGEVGPHVNHISKYVVLNQGRGCDGKGRVVTVRTGGPDLIPGTPPSESDI